MREDAPPFSLKTCKPDDYTVASVKALVVDRRGGFILELRGPQHDDTGQFNLFGGKVDGTEILLKALRRELREELHARRVPAEQLRVLTWYESDRPEGRKLNMMTCWQVRDTKRFRQGDGGQIMYFACARDALENDKVYPWLKPKTQMVIERALALGLIRYDVEGRRPKQRQATRRALEARKKLLLKEYEFS